MCEKLLFDRFGAKKDGEPKFFDKMQETPVKKLPKPANDEVLDPSVIKRIYKLPNPLE